MSKRDARKGKDRIPIHRPGTRHMDKKKQQSKMAARRWAKERFKESGQ